MDNLKKIDWTRKLTSRKFWLALAAFATSVMMYAGADPGSIEKVTSVIMTGATVIAYIVGEGLADAAGAENPKSDNVDDSAGP